MRMGLDEDITGNVTMCYHPHSMYFLMCASNARHIPISVSRSRIAAAGPTSGNIREKPEAKVMANMHGPMVYDGS